MSSVFATLKKKIAVKNRRLKQELAQKYGHAESSSDDDFTTSSRRFLDVESALQSFATNVDGYCRAMQEMTTCQALIATDLVFFCEKDSPQRAAMEEYHSALLKFSREHTTYVTNMLKEMLSVPLREHINDLPLAKDVMEKRIRKKTDMDYYRQKLAAQQTKGKPEKVRETEDKLRQATEVYSQVTVSLMDWFSQVDMMAERLATVTSIELLHAQQKWFSNAVQVLGRVEPIVAAVQDPDDNEVPNWREATAHAPYKHFGSGQAALRACSDEPYPTSPLMSMAPDTPTMAPPSSVNAAMAAKSLYSTLNPLGSAFTLSFILTHQHPPVSFASTHNFSSLHQAARPPAHLLASLLSFDPVSCTGHIPRNFRMSIVSMMPLVPPVANASAVPLEVEDMDDDDVLSPATMSGPARSITFSDASSHSRDDIYNRRDETIEKDGDNAFIGISSLSTGPKTPPFPPVSSSFSPYGISTGSSPRNDTPPPIPSNHTSSSSAYSLSSSKTPLPPPLLPNVAGLLPGANNIVKSSSGSFIAVNPNRMGSNTSTGLPRTPPSNPLSPSTSLSRVPSNPSLTRVPSSSLSNPRYTSHTHTPSSHVHTHLAPHAHTNTSPSTPAAASAAVVAVAAVTGRARSMTAAPKEYVQSVYPFHATRASELSLAEGAVVLVKRKHASGWWLGVTDEGQGYFPSNYTLPYVPTADSQLPQLRGGSSAESSTQATGAGASNGAYVHSSVGHVSGNGSSALPHLPLPTSTVPSSRVPHDSITSTSTSASASAFTPSSHATGTSAGPSGRPPPPRQYGTLPRGIGLASPSHALPSGTHGANVGVDKMNIGVNSISTINSTGTGTGTGNASASPIVTAEAPFFPISRTNTNTSMDSSYSNRSSSAVAPSEGPPSVSSFPTLSPAHSSSTELSKALSSALSDHVDLRDGVGVGYSRPSSGGVPVDVHASIGVEVPNVGGLTGASSVVNNNVMKTPPGVGMGAPRAASALAPPPPRHATPSSSLSPHSSTTTLSPPALTPPRLPPSSSSTSSATSTSSTSTYAASAASPVGPSSRAMPPPLPFATLSAASVSSTTSNTTTAANSPDTNASVSMGTGTSTGTGVTAKPGPPPLPSSLPVSPTSSLPLSPTSSLPLSPSSAQPPPLPTFVQVPGTQPTPPPPLPFSSASSPFPPIAPSALSATASNPPPQTNTNTNTSVPNNSGNLSAPHSARPPPPPFVPRPPARPMP